jgi:energy-coupling factor transporter ATP-binding protein EcfA2
VLSVEKLSKRYRVGTKQPREIWALRDVSFAASAGTILGIIGPNGAGKTTLLKVLSRVTPPTEGRVRGRGRVVPLLALGAGFQGDLSARENVCGTRRSSTAWWRNRTSWRISPPRRTSHVIHDNYDFFETDVLGTQVVANSVLAHIKRINRFIHISTSEMYGTTETPKMSEEHPLKPLSPYGSAKAGADRLFYSYWATYDLPAVIVRPFKNYGPRQHLEKAIPRFVTSCLLDEPLRVHGDGLAARDWLYVDDTCRALDRSTPSYGVPPHGGSIEGGAPARLAPAGQLRSGDRHHDRVVLPQPSVVGEAALDARDSDHHQDRPARNALTRVPFRRRPGVGHDPPVVDGNDAAWRYSRRSARPFSMLLLQWLDLTQLLLPVPLEVDGDQPEG